MFPLSLFAEDLCRAAQLDWIIYNGFRHLSRVIHSHYCTNVFVMHGKEASDLYGGTTEDKAQRKTDYLGAGGGIISEAVWNFFL